MTRGKCGNTGPPPKLYSENERLRHSDQATRSRLLPSKPRLGDEKSGCLMFRLRDRVFVCCLISITLVLCGCGGGSSGSSGTHLGPFELSVQAAGAGGGTISSTPAGITCGKTCSASFASGTQVTLTGTAAANSSFTGWTGGCSGSNSTCTLMLSASQQVTATFSATQNPAVLTVSPAGTGTGTIASNPSGINCAPTCSASFATGSAG